MINSKTWILLKCKRLYHNKWSLNKNNNKRKSKTILMKVKRSLYSMNSRVSQPTKVPDQLLLRIYQSVQRTCEEYCNLLMAMKTLSSTILSFYQSQTLTNIMFQKRYKKKIRHWKIYRQLPNVFYQRTAFQNLSLTTLKL